LPCYSAVLHKMIFLNLILGVLVTTVGFWILWGDVSQVAVALWAFTVAGFLWWKVRSITELWAWAFLLLGLESFAWPIRLMVQLKGASETPSPNEMETILTAVILGLFSSVFWISFSYGLFKRAGAVSTDRTDHSFQAGKGSQPTVRKKSR
jgi:hypothetical protein